MEYSQYSFTTGASRREAPIVIASADGEYSSDGVGAAPQDSAISLIANCETHPPSTHHPSIPPLQKSMRYIW